MIWWALATLAFALWFWVWMPRQQKHEDYEASQAKIRALAPQARPRTAPHTRAARAAECSAFEALGEFDDQ